MFAGKRGFITARDLFKWAERQPAGPQAFAEEGYLLLGERLRTAAEQSDVQQALEATWRIKVRISPTRTLQPLPKPPSPIRAVLHAA